MPKKKTKFINKKNATTFQLMPTNNSNDLEELKRKEEQLNCGIYFDDNYNYLQHLRTSSDNTNTHDFIKVPSVGEYKDDFGEEKENGTGVFPFVTPLPVQQDPQPDLDADIMEALDGECCGDDLEDDFITLANHVEGGDEDGDLNDNVDDEGRHNHISSPHDVYENDDDNEDDDDDCSGRRHDKMSEEDFKEFYEKFQGDDLDLDGTFDTVDDDAVMKTMDLLAISSKKKNVTFKEDDKPVHHNLKIVGKRKEEKEVVIVETVKRDVNITTSTDVPKKSKHQPKTVTIQFDKKKRNAQKATKSNG